ncbi:MAG: hypothetical protein U9Q67_04095, partial [Patescibacteria group bacterium]|nr:hypothetical protein [Patescibacteria group bacterium]
PAEILLVAQSSLQSVHDEASGLSIEELKSLLTSESLEKFNLDHLQQYINFLNQQGKNSRNVEWIKGYIDGTSFLGDEDYNPYASLLYFDNFLRLALARIHGFERPLAGVCEVSRLREVAHKEREPLCTYIKDGEYFFVELMGCSVAEIQEMHDIYIHGFGDHLPMSHEQHQEMANNGDTIAIRDERGNLVALRAIVYDASSSYPVDPEIRPDHAYQNHTIIINECRGKGHGEELISATKMLAQREGKTSILTSVAPKNGRNLSFLTRNGYRIIIYSQDHFGEGENRYLLELMLGGSQTEYSTDYFINLIQDNDVAEITSDITGEIHDEDYYLVCVTDVNIARVLLDNGYIGIRVIRGSYIKKDANRSYILFNKPE